MGMIFKRTLALAAGLAMAAFITIAPPAPAQDGPGWTVLLDGKNMGDWDRNGETNWRLEDGAVVADKKPEKGTAHLVTKQKYKDFEIYAEFWATTETNSGIFIRCQDAKNIGAKNCYEVNIWDARKDPSYGTGAIVNFAEVNPMPRAGGRWNTFHIIAKGREITVMMNGQQTVKLRNGMFEEGPFTLQYGEGVIKWRKVAVKPL